jgi:uncharacterized protein (TIGR02996 family)
MNDEHAFMQAMQQHPEDNALRLVFGDWLEERGDLRGVGSSGGHAMYRVSVVYLVGVLLFSSFVCSPGCVNEEPGTDKKLADASPDIERLIRQLGSAEFQERERAATELIAVGSPALGQLRKAMKSADLEVALRAESCVVVIEANVIIATQLAILKDLQADQAKRYDAASILGHLRSRATEAVPALLEVLQTEPAAELRTVAARSLGQIGDGDNPKVMPALLKALKHDPDDGVRLTAAGALGHIRKDPATCVPALVEALKKHKDLITKSNYSPRGIILGSLADFGPDAKPAVPLLIELLQDNRANTDHALYVRKVIIQTLCSIGPGAKEAVPILQDLLQKDRLNDPEIVKALNAIQPDSQHKRRP